MKKVVLVCGTISGVIVASLMVASSIKCYYSQDYQNGMIYGYASMLLAFSLIFVGVKTYRDKFNSGTISFGKAFKVGMFIALISSSFYVVTWLVEYYMFIPDFMDKYAAHMLKGLERDKLSDAVLASKLKEISGMQEMYKNPLLVVLITYSEVLPVGLLVALIAALVLKRKQNNAARLATS